MSHISSVRTRTRAAPVYTPAERDYYVWQRRLTAWQQDRHEVASEASDRRELRHQVYAAIRMYRLGRAPHPGDLSEHRLSHTDSIRRERARYPIPGLDPFPHAISAGA